MSWRTERTVHAPRLGGLVDVRRTRCRVSSLPVSQAHMNREIAGKIKQLFRRTDGMTTGDNEMSFLFSKVLSPAHLEAAEKATSFMKEVRMARRNTCSPLVLQVSTHARRVHRTSTTTRCTRATR